MPRGRFGLWCVGGLFALLGLADRASAQCSGQGTTTYNSSGGVSVTAGTISTSTNQISVSVPAGSTITCVSVALNGATSSGTGPFGSMRYASFMLTAPGGQRLEFLGATGDGTDGDDMRDSGSGLDGVNIAVWDGASSSAPYYPAIWPHTGSVPVKPSSYVNAPNNLEGVPPLEPPHSGRRPTVAQPLPVSL